MMSWNSFVWFPEIDIWFERGKKAVVSLFFSKILNYLAELGYCIYNCNGHHVLFRTLLPGWRMWTSFHFPMKQANPFSCPHFLIGLTVSPLQDLESVCWLLQLLQFTEREIYRWASVDWAQSLPAFLRPPSCREISGVRSLTASRTFFADRIIGRTKVGVGEQCNSRGGYYIVVRPMLWAL